MSLQLPPERDLPDPDAMFQRILMDQQSGSGEAMDRSGRGRLWLLPVAAALVLLVGGLGLLFRDRAPSDTANAPPNAAAPSVSSNAVATKKDAVQSVYPSFDGPGTAVMGDLKLTVEKGEDRGLTIEINVTICSSASELLVVSLQQWSLAGSPDLTAYGPYRVDLSPGACKPWTVRFATEVRPATFVFLAGDGTTARWTFY